MSIPMKCEKCGAVSGFAPRFPCVHPPCDGERYLDKDALRTEVLTELSPTPAEQLTNPSTLAGNVNNPGVELDWEEADRQAEAAADARDLETSPRWPEEYHRTFRAYITRQHRALVDAAVARARDEGRDEGREDADAWYTEQYAPLLALVEEWQEARKEWEACKPGPFPWSAENKTKADRIDRAEAALAAWTR